MRLPWDKFFYREFLRDTAALSNSHAGMWIRILGHTWESPRRGYLLHPSGHPFTDEDTARMLGVPVSEWLECKDVLIRFGIASVDKRDVVFNRRQVREEKTRSKERLRKGDERQNQRKSLLNQRKCPESVREVSVKGPVENTEERIKNISPYPLSNKTDWDPSDGFRAFLAAYPRDRAEDSPLAMQYYIQATGGLQDRHERLMLVLARYVAATEPRFVKGMAKWLSAPPWHLAEAEPPMRYKTVEELRAEALS